MKRVGAVVLLAIVPMVGSPVFARDLNYDYVNLSYASVTIVGVAGTGFALSGSYDLAPDMDINLVGSYRLTNFPGGAVSEYELGFGYHAPVGSGDLLTEIRAVGQEFPGGTLSFAGVAWNIGVRALVNGNFEFKGTFGTETLFDSTGASGSGSRYDLSGLYHVNDQLGIGLGYYSSDAGFSESVVSIGARYALR